MKTITENSNYQIEIKNSKFITELIKIDNEKKKYGMLNKREYGSTSIPIDINNYRGRQLLSSPYFYWPK